MNTLWLNRVDYVSSRVFRLGWKMPIYNTVSIVRRCQVCFGALWDWDNGNSVVIEGKSAREKDILWCTWNPRRKWTGWEWEEGPLVARGMSGMASPIGNLIRVCSTVWVVQWRYGMLGVWGEWRGMDYLSPTLMENLRCPTCFVFWHFTWATSDLRVFGLFLPEWSWILGIVDVAFSFCF